MKKILFICAGHSLDDERVTRKEAVSLSTFGYDVTVCAQCQRQYSEPRVKMIDVDTLEEVKDAKRRDTSRTGTRAVRIARLKNIKKLILRERPDLVVAHEFETAFLAWRLHCTNGLKYVFDAHECYEETMHLIFPKIIQPIARMVLKWMLHRVVDSAVGVNTASESNGVFRRGKSKGIPSVVLHNSPRLEYFPFSEEEKNPIVLVHDGNLTFERGALEILDALAIVKEKHDFIFMTLGNIPDEVRVKFEEKLDKLKLRNNVDMRGHLPWTEFGAIESTGQIGLICSQPIPNHLKSLSNKLYNYMATGLAIIGMKNSETESIIRNARCGICPDTSKPEEIAKAIIYLIDHPEERRQMARNGRKAIEEKYSWERMEEVMKEFYGSLKI